MRTREQRIFNIIGHIIMIFLTITAVVPMILMLISSLTSEPTIVRNGYNFFPEEWSTYAYRWVFTSNGSLILRAYGMSFLVTGIGTACSLVITTLFAYGLSKKGLPGRGLLTFLVFFTMLFNAGLVPSYMNYTQNFHLKDTFLALIVPNLMMNAFNVLLMKSYFQTAVPDEILEAAYIDGANESRTMLQVAIPLSKPIIATIGLFVGIAYWNDWNNGFIYLVKRADLYTIQNLLNRLMQSITMLQQNANNLGNVNEGLAMIPSVTVRMAMATLGILPIVIVYPFIQNNFVKGITLGGVKG